MLTVATHTAVRNSRRKSKEQVNLAGGPQVGHSWTLADDPAPDPEQEERAKRCSWRDIKIEEERDDAQRLLAEDTRLQDAMASTSVQMMKAREFARMTIGDVHHLLKILGSSSEYIEYEQLRTLLVAAMDPPFTNEEVQALWNLSEKRPDGRVSAEEIHKAMTTGLIRQKLDEIHNDNHKRRPSKDTGPLVDRELFKTWVAWRQNRDDAFQTLPLAVTYLLVFVMVVMTHLQIAGRER